MTRNNSILSKLICIAAMCGVQVSAAEVRVASPAALVTAITKSRPGDEIVLANGLYQDAGMKVHAHGTVERPIVIRPETPGKVRFSGKSQITIGGSNIHVRGFVFDQVRSDRVILFQGAENCVLAECAFFECGPNNSSYSPIISLASKSQNNLITRCSMQGNLSIGMAVIIGKDDYENTHNTFSWNYFKDIVRRSSNGQEAVQIGQGGFSDRTSQFAVVEHCLFDNASGDPEIISNKSSDNTYRFNTFRNCEGMLALRGGNRARVEGNFFFNCLGGIRLHGSGHLVVSNYIEGCRGRGIYMPAGSRHYGPVNNCVVAHNTIINCGQGMHIGRLGAQETDWELQIAFNDFLKNLIVINGEVGMGIQDNGSHASTWRGNIVWTSGGAKPGLKSKGVAWVDPSLVKKNGVFRLGRSDSPAVNVASVNFRDVNAAIPGVETDFDGHTRDHLPDAGCDEWSEESASRGPLSPKEVGPAWMHGKQK